MTVEEPIDTATPVPEFVEDIRAVLQETLKSNGTWGTPTVGDDGWAAYVKDEYGRS